MGDTSHVDQHTWMLVFNEDVSEEGAAGTEHSFVSLQFETIRGDQGDISEVSAPPDFFQICSGIFLEILTSQKHLTYSNHLEKLVLK